MWHKPGHPKDVVDATEVKQRIIVVVGIKVAVIRVIVVGLEVIVINVFINLHVIIHSRDHCQLYWLLIRSFYLWTRLADGGTLHHEDIITVAWLTIVVASALVPLGLLIEHHITYHMDMVCDDIVHMLHHGATLVADENHFVATIL
jgi:hypothetical protein